MHQTGSLSLERKTLAAVHRSWGFPTDEELLWLLEKGIDQDVLWPISRAKVRFARNIFELDDNGEPVLTFRATDRGEVVDLVAWKPQTGALASWRGQAFCLGDLDDVFNPATYFSGGALHLHENPLQWLLAERAGIVIVRPDLAHAYLTDCPRVVCSHAAHARQVARWLQRPKPRIGIFVAVEERPAA
jgi:hypothetical protein